MCFVCEGEASRGEMRGNRKETANEMTGTFAEANTMQSGLCSDLMTNFFANTCRTLTVGVSQSVVERRLDTRERKNEETKERKRERARRR